MAQYYHVLSQTDKNGTEELRQYYPSVVESQTVQYVINSEDQTQQFQGQQILLSSDQLMLIENSQPVIVDQSIAYQNPQYILQDNGIDFQSPRQPQQHQQLYYMEEVDGDRQVHIEQSVQQAAQPIVLNHQLQPPQIQASLNKQVKTSIPVQVRQAPPQIQSQQIQVQSSVRQALQQQRTVGSQPMPRHRIVTQKNVQQPACPSPQRSHISQPTQLQQIPVKSPSGNHETAVALSDGSIMILTDCKQAATEAKPRANLPMSASTQQRMEAPPLAKFGTSIEQPKTKSERTASKTKSPRRNAARGNENSPVQYSIPDSTSSVQQQLYSQQQMKLLNQSQQKQNAPTQNHYLQHQTQQRQQLQQQQPVRQMQSQPQPQQQHYVQPQYIIQPPSQHQPHSQCPLPPYVASRQIQQIIENTPACEEYSDSIRMLVLLENGEQRLITFTLPKEVCTIQEILEQVGVPFHPDTKIECMETNHSGINYFVTVGVHHFETNVVQEEVPELDDQSIPQSTDMQKADMQISTEADTESDSALEVEAPRYVPGLLAVCNHCGYTSENFSRCLRCKYKLPNDVKTIPALSSGTNGKNSDALKALASAQEKKLILQKSAGVPNKQLVNLKRKKAKVVDPEPVVLTLSSGEEDADDEVSNNKLSETDQLIKRLSASAVTLSTIKKEPSISDIQQNSNDVDETGVAVRGGGKDDVSELATTFLCRTVRIGSYRYIPHETITVSSKGLVLKVPSFKDAAVMKSITIERKQVVKVLVNFQKALPVVFYYVTPFMGQLIRDQLDMAEGGEFYFDPLSKEEAYKRITLLPENVDEDTKAVFKCIYGKPTNIMDELTTVEANEILVKTCPKELSKVIASSGYTEIKTLLIYPPGKGGLPINTEDYVCLGQDQFLNDVIIDFYLKHIVLNLPKEQQGKVHVFSTFFYKRLTTKPLKASRRSHPAELDPTLTPAQKRHARVEKWTKNVNLFEKDYVIIPINENCHWFLAIVCFPGMDGCTTVDGKPIVIVPKQKKSILNATAIGNVTITAVKKEKEDKTITCDDGEGSDRDEAEGDESELESGEDSEEPEPPEPPQVERVEKQKRLPIKQPCILIFDSLAGASRARVVATLRDYLTCEYKAKMGKERIYNKDVIKGSCPKIPQQTNFTDCGLYLLQYVEQFFNDPIKDYHIPIKQLNNWFEEFIVTRKREDISLLIKELMVKYNKDPSCLPDIAFPTLNGKLVIHNPEEEEDEFADEFEEDEDEEMLDEAETSDMFNDGQIESDSSQAGNSINHCDPNEDKLDETDLKPSKGNVKECDGFVEQTVSLLKPAISELRKQSSKDTLLYLKSKRINRHKHNDSHETKKFKASTE